MTNLWIDTDRAATVARSWAERGDALARGHLAIEGDLERLHLGTARSTAVERLANASTELWVTSAFVHLVVERVLHADASIGPADVAALRAAAGHRVRTALTDVCRSPWATPVYSSAGGDLGATPAAEVRSPFFVVGATPAARGRSLVARALSDTAAAAQIRADEFELVELSNGAFLVVLPGVTDLSSPDLGLSDHHRSARDLDQHAYPSSRSTGVSDNRYAELVWQALADAGVPAGADLMIVGHSFGADTALDLAADETFNGPDGFRVTHVVAAGYYSDPQLEHVDPRTRVLVLQNHRDAAVIVEAAGHGHPTEAVEAAASTWRDVRDFDVAGAVGGVADTAYHGAGALVDGVQHTIDRADALDDIAIGAATFDRDRVADGAARFVMLEPATSQPHEGQVHHVFVGGAIGAGHHPVNYVDQVVAVDDELLLDFFASIDRAGYTTTGTAWAIDVSVPAP